MAVFVAFHCIGWLSSGGVRLEVASQPGLQQSTVQKPVGRDGGRLEEPTLPLAPPRRHFLMCSKIFAGMDKMASRIQSVDPPRGFASATVRRKNKLIDRPSLQWSS